LFFCSGVEAWPQKAISVALCPWTKGTVTGAARREALLSQSHSRASQNDASERRF